MTFHRTGDIFTDEQTESRKTKTLVPPAHKVAGLGFAGSDASVLSLLPRVSSWGQNSGTFRQWVLDRLITETQTLTEARESLRHR